LAQPKGHSRVSKIPIYRINPNAIIILEEIKNKWKKTFSQRTPQLLREASSTSPAGGDPQKNK
jgi:hypothetical protein